MPSICQDKQPFTGNSVSFHDGNVSNYEIMSSENVSMSNQCESNKNKSESSVCDSHYDSSANSLDESKNFS